MEKIKVIATLRDTRDGFTKDYIEEIDKEAFEQKQKKLFGIKQKMTEKEYEDNRRFMWLEGNWSCDCNRSLFLYDGDETKELPCSAEENVIELLKLTVNDKVIYEKTKSPNSTELGLFSYPKISDFYKLNCHALSLKNVLTKSTTRPKKSGIYFFQIFIFTIIKL